MLSGQQFGFMGGRPLGKKEARSAYERMPRLPQQQMKMLVFMRWIVNSHKSLLAEGEQEIPQEQEEDKEYNALYRCCKKHLEEAGALEKYRNYYAIAQKLNNEIERFKRAVLNVIGENGCTLMMFIVGALRHCNFETLKGFDDLKEINLDAIIARAREEHYLNPWAIQRLCRNFKFGYWEA